MTYHVIKRAVIENVQPIKNSEFFNVFTSEGTFMTKQYHNDACEAIGNLVDFCVYTNKRGSYFSRIIQTH